MSTEIVQGELSKRKGTNWKSFSYCGGNSNYPECFKACYTGKFLKAITESDSLTTIQAINEKSIPPRHISNLIEDINTLAKDIENVTFVYCRGSSMV